MYTTHVQMIIYIYVYYILNWKSIVLEPHPMARKKMSQMLTIRPREIVNIWSGGMFGCFDDGAICILTCFCPCIQFGLNMAYNQHDHYKFFGWTCTNKAFFSSCIIQAMVCLAHMRHDTLSLLSPFLFV